VVSSPVTKTPFTFTLAMEFGLRAGQHQPSSNTHVAASCPHNIPAPVVIGLPVKFASAPAPSGGTGQRGRQVRGHGAVHAHRHRDAPGCQGKRHHAESALR
jgi:hypothetical protein